MIIKLILNKYQQALTANSWPGNVRELQNLLTRISILSDTNTDGPIEGLVRDILNEMLQICPAKDIAIQQPAPTGLKNIIENTELALIARLYKQANYNKSELAKQLGVSRTTLWRKLNKLGLK
jgi:transcriptional regulator with PAS, ATPase and Fis domain